MVGILQVEVGDLSFVDGCQRAGQSRLAHLAGADQTDDGELIQELPQVLKVAGARDHSTILP